MRSLDTNILVRALVSDHEVQSPKARAIMAEPCLILPTVVLETVWVLASRTSMNAPTIAAVIMALTDMPHIVLADRSAVIWALERFRRGADFPDMLHLALSRAADSFATFDRSIARYADAEVVSVETLA